MVIYSKYKTSMINPKTGVSVVFDKNHYKGDKAGQGISLPLSTATNACLSSNRKEVMILLAYGVGYRDTCRILEVLKNIKEPIRRSLSDSYFRKCCTYYSNHLDALKKLIGDFKPIAESYIDYYEENKNKVHFQVKSANSIKNDKLDLSNAETEIKKLLNSLLLYTRQIIPDDYDDDILRSQELELKLKIQNCDSIELLNEYYGELLTVLNQKQEIRENEVNHQNLKAIRYLRQCGFTEAAYKWLKCFPNK